MSEPKDPDRNKSKEAAAEDEIISTVVFDLNRWEINRGVFNSSTVDLQNYSLC